MVLISGWFYWFTLGNKGRWLVGWKSLALRTRNCNARIQSAPLFEWNHRSTTKSFCLPPPGTLLGEQPD